MEDDRQREAEDDVVVLPVTVRMAGGALGLTGLLAMILGAQLLLISGGKSEELSLLLFGLLGLGVAAIGAGLGAGRGSVPGTFAGIVVALLLVPCALYPMTYGIVAVSMFGVAGLGGVATLLLLISVPACVRFTRFQKKLMED